MSRLLIDAPFYPTEELVRIAREKPGAGAYLAGFHDTEVYDVGTAPVLADFGQTTETGAVLKLIGIVAVGTMLGIGGAKLIERAFRS